MVPGMISQAAQGLVWDIMEYTKEASGANESSMGEQVGAQLNASAIMMLQKAAGIPIDSIKRRFYVSMKRIGEIWEEFFKVNYNTTRLVKLKDENQDPYTASFNGSDHQDTQFELKIDIGPSSGYSESMVMNTLDKFYDKGDIDISMYLKYVPANVAPFKERMLKDIQQHQDQQQQQMTQQNQPIMPNAIDQLLAQLPKNEQDLFKKMPPEQQMAITNQMMAHLQQQQGQQGQPQMMQGQPSQMPPQQNMPMMQAPQ
jgi:hypothetical protein